MNREDLLRCAEKLKSSGVVIAKAGSDDGGANRSRWDVVPWDVILVQLMARNNFYTIIEIEEDPSPKPLVLL